VDRHRRDRISKSVMRLGLALVLTVTAASCGGEDPDAPEAANPSTSTAPSSADAPSVDGSFEVEGGRKLAIRCWGEGSPTIVLETGHPNPGGIQDFEGSPFVAELVKRSRVCAYDRAGTGASDPAPNRPRSADDVVQDLYVLLDAAEIEAPYVLVGASFGGMIVTYYASQHPDDVEGVALLDVPAPSDELTVKEIPEIAWNHPQNPEHVDVVNEFEGRFARTPVP
jgi:pimeloyl-ACP methyl ester carboxylesterase